jgi:hypothetical protein
MILQNHWYMNCEISKDKGFWLTGKDYNDCIKQLKEYGKNHPEKWIFFSDCGMRPAKPIPTPEQLFEVMIADKCPTGMFMWSLFQEGYEHLKEELTSEQKKNQLLLFAMLGTH